MKKYIVCFHVFILLFALAAMPASAIGSPSLPLTLSGNIEIDGTSAPVGTEIVVKLNDNIVANTTVTLEGVYGDTPQNKLYVSCSPEDYVNLIFYVNGVESDLIDTSILQNANPGEIIEDTNIAAPEESSTSGQPSEGDDSSSGGSSSGDSSSSSSRSSSGGSGGGYSSYAEDMEVTDAAAEEPVEDEVSEESASEEELMAPVSEMTGESSEEATSVPEKSSIGSIGMIAIGLIVVIGAIATVKYKSQK